MTIDARKRRGPLVESWALALIGILVVGMSFWISFRGLDRTDEGLYLNSIAHPRDDRSTILLFGYVYHPIYLLVGGDVVLLRWAGTLLTILAVGSLSWVALGTTSLSGRTPAPVHTRIAASMALGVTGLTTIAQMPATPNYNTLTLQGLCLTTTGLFLAVTRHGKRGTAGAALIGIGAWLTFMGKPTTAAVLGAILVASTVALPGPWRRRLLIAVTALITACAITLSLADLSPAAFYRILTNGLAVATALGGHDEILRLDSLPTTSPTFLTVIWLGFISGLLIYVQARGSTRVMQEMKPGQRSTWASVGLGLFGFTMISGYALASYQRGIAFKSSDALAAMVVSCGAALVVLSLSCLNRLRRTHLDGEHAKVTRVIFWRTDIVLFGILVSLPVAYAFGTNINLWTAQGRAMCFWVMALYLLLVRRSDGVQHSAFSAIPLVSSTSLVAILLIATVAMPYRYESLDSAIVPSTVGSGSLRLTKEDHVRVSRVEDLHKKLHVDTDTRVLDLTGDSPGSIFILGARPAGQAWILGGYSGSERAARLAISNDRCSARQAFVLAAPTSPRAIPSRVLEAIGRDLNDDYEVVGSFPRTRWFRGRETLDTVLVYGLKARLQGQVCRDG